MEKQGFNRTINQGDKSTYNEINNFIVNSVDYQKLIKEIADLKEDISEASSDERRQKKRADLAKAQERLTQMKDAVAILYEKFNHLELNTELRRKAKEHFDKGMFREADAILKEELLTSELDKIIFREQQLEKEKENLLNSRKQLAEEFIVKAQIQGALYDNPNWFEKACNYYREALRAHKSADNLFSFAYFLRKNSRISEAKANYQESLDIYRTLAKNEPDVYLPYVAVTLNNLASLQQDLGDFKTAKENYLESLDIRRKLAKNEPDVYLPDVAVTLNNLALLQQALGDFETAKENYLESLDIRRKLAKNEPDVYLPDVALTLNNLASLQKDLGYFKTAKENYLESLDIYRKLAKNEPDVYLPYVAVTLNNLALLQKALGDFKTAKENFLESLDIRRKLAKNEPDVYLPYVAVTLNNLAMFYTEAIPNKDIAVNLALEAFDILYPIYKKAHYLEQYYNNIISLLEYYEYDINSLLNKG